MVYELFFDEFTNDEIGSRNWIVKEGVFKKLIELSKINNFFIFFLPEKFFWKNLEEQQRAIKEKVKLKWKYL